MAHHFPLRLLAATVVSAAALVLAAPANAADRSRLELVNSFSGLRADVMWGSTNDFQGVFLWPDNTSASQEFDLLDSGNGYFRIRARHSGKCLMLDWRSGNSGNGTRVIQYPFCGTGYAPAEWRLRTLSGTRCSGNICTTGIDQTVLVNRATGRCLDADNGKGGRPPSQAVLQQWDCVTSTDAWNIGNQAWDLLPPGSHRID
ncbi:RICIN domain-containing protein [Archangium gephyra]|uniref:RICIN domain-containing protein n=1 Tax=Archangium gephyra TaxID=48 RepID=UPI0035D3E509